MRGSLPPEFHPAISQWFTERFGEPTLPQKLGWPLIAAGKHTLILAPTGSGKTLAAFLAGINAVVQELLEPLSEEREKGVRILYISPLKALNYDIDRNLSEPLDGIQQAARDMGLALPEIRTAVRTGDTPASERRKMLKNPPHILITTPESLHIILTSAARQVLQTVRYVIVDEIHSVCANKRGVFLSILLERLEDICRESPVRVGLSATQKPLEEVAKFLGGFEWSETFGQEPVRGQDTLAQRVRPAPNYQLSTINSQLSPRPVEIVDAGMRKETDLRVICPVDDLRHPSEGSVWPAIHRELLELVRSHKSTIIFANTRRMVERITVGINELAGEDLVEPHHGSIAAQVRRRTEDRLKKGALKGVVATGTLELGIDMGAVDLVCQIESPKEVSRGLQRVGRAGHLYSEVSKGRILPKTPADLAESVAVATGMLAGDVEPIGVPKNCLDVLAQQIVAMAALGSMDSNDIFRTVRRAYPYAELSEELFNRTLQMVAGRYPAKAFRDLRPRVSLDRISGRVSPLPGSQRLVIANGGAIPDTGEYPVYLQDTNVRLGELDEEFVFEAREGDVFSLGVNAWRISRIEPDRVLVTRTSSPVAQPPFWRGESVPRTAHVGRRMGLLLREMADRGVDSQAWAEENLPVDAGTAQNLTCFVQAQAASWEGGRGLPTDRRIVLETFLDEIGERRLAVLTTFGGRVHQALRIALVALCKRELQMTIESMVGDNGVLFRLPDAEAPPPHHLFKMLTPDLAYELIVDDLPNTALFGLRFRQNAARALLLPGARPGKRTPLWLQRLKARDLLQIAKSFDAFPIVVETYRECLQDYLDLPVVRDLLAQVQSGKIEVEFVERVTASPFAASLLLDFQMVYQYEWDEPKGPTAERRAPAERRLVSELVDGKLRRPIDERAVKEMDARLQGTAERFQARTAEELYEMLRRVGDLSAEECLARISGGSPDFVERLADEGQIVLAQTPQGDPTERWIANDYLDEYAAAYGPDSEDRRTAREALAERYVLNRAAVTAAEVIRRYGFDDETVASVIGRLLAKGQVVEIPPAEGSTEPRWCAAEHLESLYRRTLAAARQEAKPASSAQFADFLLLWQHRDPDNRLAGPEGLRRALSQLQGLRLPFSVWEAEILARRIPDYRPDHLDGLCSSGEFVWQGAAGGEDRVGRIAFFERSDFPTLCVQTEAPTNGRSAEIAAVRESLRHKGASFLIDIAAATGLDSRIVLRLLWEMIWTGEVTHDSFRVLRSGKPTATTDRAAAPRRFVHDRRRLYAAKREIAKTFSKLDPAPGRWTLLESLVESDISDEERAALIARILLERYGVVARDLVVQPYEVGPVPWAVLYEVYQRMELAGEIERGYYVEGLSGAQFGLPEACDLLMQRRRAGLAPEAKPGGRPLLINSCDPVFLFASPGPFEIPGNRLLRLPTNYAVLRDGLPVLLIELAAHRITPARELSEEELTECLAELERLFDSPWPVRTFRKAEIAFWGGEPVIGSEAERPLLRAGFERGPRTMVMRGRIGGEVES